QINRGKPNLRVKCGTVQGSANGRDPHTVALMSECRSESYQSFPAGSTGSAIMRFRSLAYQKIASATRSGPCCASHPIGQYRRGAWVISGSLEGTCDPGGANHQHTGPKLSGYATNPPTTTPGARDALPGLLRLEIIVDRVQSCLCRSRQSTRQKWQRSRPTRRAHPCSRGRSLLAAR